MARLVQIAFLTALFSSVQFSAFGDDAVVFEQVNLRPADNAGDISRFIIANDFELLEPTRLTGLQVWLTDAFQQNDNNVLDNFGGTLGWALYEDKLGRPETFITSGHDSQPLLADAGFQGGGQEDVLSAKLILPSVQLAAGIYWLALNEGEWSTAHDGSSIAWYNSKDSSGSDIGFGSRSFQDSNETGDVRFWEVGSSAEYSFALSGVIVPEPISFVPAFWFVLVLGITRKLQRRPCL